MEFNFSKTNRLLKTLEFRGVLDQGMRVASPEMVVFGQRSANSSARLGLIVSRKVGKAVVRNRIKRRLREAFRLHKHGFDGVDIVVIARHLASQKSNDSLTHSFNNCLSKLQPRLQAK